jgi:NitT/TauT family transport system permease protein
LLLGSVPVLNVASRALIEFLRPIPSIAIVPAVIIILGLGVEMRLFVVAYAATWPILFNTVYGLMEVDPLAKETARSFGFGRLTILTRIGLISAAPFIVTGIRLSAGIALIVEVSIELLIGGEGGLGELLRSSQSGGTRLDVALAIITFAGLLGVLANSVLQEFSRRAFGWSSLVDAR